MAFEIRRRSWDAAEEMSAIASRVSVPETARAEFEVELWNDLCSEHDSIHFYRHARLHARRYSLEFRDFLEAWKADEENHARGFMKLYQTAFGGTPSAILSRLESRLSSFDKLATFFEDEFKLCLLITYDEMVTTIAYHLDRSFYREIGGKALEDWISRVKADEALHFSNLLSVIRERHRHRIAEGAGILQEILELDLKQTDYDGTFVLDHTGAPFTPELLSDCSKRIANKLEALL